MTMLWASISILTLLVLGMLAIPLLRRQNDNKPTTADYDVAVYKSQLVEVEREAARGAFSPEEAEASRAEISRRLLAADSKSKSTAQTSEPESELSMKFMAALVALLVGIASIALYLELGNPALLSNPLAFREVERAQAQAEAAAVGGMDDVIDKLEAKLAVDPNSVEGWMLLGRSYLTINRLDKSLESYAKAVSVDRTHLGLLSTYGEVMVMDAQGSILEPAMAIFREALALDDNDVRARFYLAQGDYQVGRPVQALEAYIALANSAPANAPWQPMVREAATEIANELDMDVSSRLPEASETNGPDANDMAAAAEMEEGDRQAMIEGMVAKLSERLEGEPDNLEGWMRLGQSYMVLGRYGESADAFDKAVALSPDNSEILLKKGRALRAQNTEVSNRAARQVMDKVLSMDGANLEALWMVAIDEADQGNKQVAAKYFGDALALVGEASSDYIELRMEADGILANIK